MIEIKYKDGDVLFFRDIKRVRFNNDEKYLVINDTDNTTIWGGEVSVGGFGFYKSGTNFCERGEDVDYDINNLNDVDKIMLSMSDEYCLVVNADRVLLDKNSN